MQKFNLIITLDIKQQLYNEYKSMECI